MPRTLILVSAMGLMALALSACGSDDGSDRDAALSGAGDCSLEQDALSSAQDTLAAAEAASAQTDKALSDAQTQLGAAQQKLAKAQAAYKKKKSAAAKRKVKTAKRSLAAAQSTAEAAQADGDIALADLDGAQQGVDVAQADLDSCQAAAAGGDNDGGSGAGGGTGTDTGQEGNGEHSDPPPANEAPTASGVTFGMRQGSTYLKDLSDYASDPEGGPLTWKLVQISFGASTHGFTWFGNGQFKIKPLASVGAKMYLYYKVIDPEGAESKVAEVTMSILAPAS